MLKLLNDIAFLCAGLLVLIALFWACTYERNRWRAALEADFTARLGSLDIDGYELMVDKVTLPTPIELPMFTGSSTTCRATIFFTSRTAMQQGHSRPWPGSVRCRPRK
ncbi:hypothetical protein [Pseudomonas mosselii]|uniref:DUF3301 domain-containing protein n=1 Tax=Pseudomonas mosselii TaxID=78327 RepID=A0A7W2JVR6_9PSED|nr:hypothetical protein [Pseudomonas mosselii]MBA6066059.1 hypothetical protein [Pseudomonas mosselii]